MNALSNWIICFASNNYKKSSQNPWKKIVFLSLCWICFPTIFKSRTYLCSTGFSTYGSLGNPSAHVLCLSVSKPWVISSLVILTRGMLFDVLWRSNVFWVSSLLIFDKLLVNWTYNYMIKVIIWILHQHDTEVIIYINTFK